MNPLGAAARLVADDTRATLLATLMSGRAFTGRELARAGDVSPATASHHLSKLLDAGLVTVRPQGRHRYFRLADRGVAETLEALGCVPIDGPAVQRRVGPDLRYARSCYDHLAGELGVRFAGFLHAAVPGNDDSRAI